jgi:proteic killer suppression protein
VCTIVCEAEKKYNYQMAYKIHKCIDIIKAASTVEELLQFHLGRCHLLKGDRQGQYAMHLVQPYRLIFEKKEGEIQIVNVIEIVDYH